jgi:hypothetical protein
MSDYEQIFLDMKGLSQRVPVSLRTLRSWVTKGMPHRKIGGRLLIYWPAFCEWVNGEKPTDEEVNEHVERLAKKFETPDEAGNSEGL